MKLEGKIAAITGGTAGMGPGLPKRSWPRAARWLLFAAMLTRARKVLEELGAGDRAIFIAGDVMEQADLEGFIDQTHRPFRARSTFW